ncbi:hypothetical protein ONZ51_g10956 [Trametes cubensis]|uniref:Uncharacterized protein n=1 Tax=Trametes cubensis TaxID=1111947 RepID=A0AAD7X8C7_9APHY|nr:hypothetical protein ONZ51_g10956 [Trametes cubensis]
MLRRHLASKAPACSSASPCHRPLSTNSPPAPTTSSRRAKLAPSFTKPLCFALAIFLSAYVFLFRSAPTPTTSANRIQYEDHIAMSATSAKGWHARARPHPSSADFVPARDNLVFAVLLNAPADPEGFTVALFRPDVAVNARGQVLQVQSDDFTALADLAEQVIRLPETGSFMNAWRVAHDRTDRKIDRLFVPTSSGEIKQTSVQGWHPERKHLKTPVAEYTELPPPLYELFGYIQEGRDGYQRGHEDNKDLIAKIKALVED